MLNVGILLAHHVGMTLEKNRVKILVSCLCRLSQKYVSKCVNVRRNSSFLGKINDVFCHAHLVTRAVRNRTNILKNIKNLFVLYATYYITHNRFSAKLSFSAVGILADLFHRLQSESRTECHAITGILRYVCTNARYLFDQAIKSREHASATDKHDSVV